MTYTPIRHIIMKPYCKHGHKRTPENINAKGGCKICLIKRSHEWLVANRSRNNATKAAWRKKNEEKYGNYQRRFRYGITKDRLEEMRKQQKNKCLGCGVKFSRTCKKNVPHVDHNHSCCPGRVKCGGKCIRGLLCFLCNNVLGLSKDNPATLTRLAKYLRKKR